MTSTRGTRTFDLPPSVQHALTASGFTEMMAGGVEAPHVWTHRLAPGVGLHLSMSPRTRTTMIYKFTSVPEHLVGELPSIVKGTTVEAFCDELVVFDGRIQDGYERGPKMIDRTGLTD